MKKMMLSVAMWAFIVFVPAHVSFAYSTYSAQQYQLYWCQGYYSYSPCATYSQYQYYYPTYYSYPQYYYPQYYYYPTYGYANANNYNYNYNYNYNGGYWW